MRMLTVTLLILSLGLTGLSPAAVAQSSTATVHLVVTSDVATSQGLDPGGNQALPGTAACDVTVATDADAGDVLDQAVADGCILEWDHDTFGDQRFVTSIDGLRAVGLTCILYPTVCQWWEFQVNGEAAGFGIDGYQATEDDTIRFFYHSA